MHKINNKGLKELGIETGSSLVGAGVGLAIAGPAGAILGAVITPTASYVLKRTLARKERERVGAVYELTIKKIQEKIDNGAGLRKDLDRQRLTELTEGTFLKSRDAYEEKKLPLIANLLATAPFTSTPLENLIQTLIYAEQLSYRQLCILAVVGQNEWEGSLKLSEDPLAKKSKYVQLDEKVEGIYSDLNHLLTLGIIGQELSKGAGPAVASGMFLISPARLRLLYPGRLLFNGMLLDTIPKEDFDDVVELLKT